MPVESSAMRLSAASRGQSAPRSAVPVRLVRQDGPLAVAHEANRSAPWLAKYGKCLLVTDLVAVVTAVVTAQLVRFGNTIGQPALAVSPKITYLEISALVTILWMVTLSINHSRSARVIGSGAEEYRRVWLATMAVFGGIAIVSMLFKLEVARGYLMIATPVGLVLIFLSRWIARKVIVHVRKSYGRCVTRLLVVGSPRTVRDLTVALSREPWSGYDVVGACIPGPLARSHISVPGIGNISVLGDESMVADAVAATGSHAVAVAATESFHGKGLRDLSWELEGLDIDLLVSPGVIDVVGPRLHMRPVAGLPLIHVEKPQYHGAKKFQKRAFDVCFSGLALLCGVPVLLLIGLAVKLTSHGPIFYRQERIGIDGEPFDMFKFRTMIVGADSMLEELAVHNESKGGVLFKMKNDPRVTFIGRFLRKYSLDELPQFFNVLKGDMSVVGPRPHPTAEAALYDQEAMRRLLVRPGITGLWQVSGRSDLDWEDAVRLDLYYVENWSMMADLLIAFKTLRIVLRPSGAY